MAEPSKKADFFAFAWRYGLRSLARNRRRAALVTATVGLSTLVSVLGMSYASAVMRVWSQGAIEFGLAHAQIHTRAYWDNPDVLRKGQLLRDEDPALAQVLSSKVVSAVSRRIRFEGTIASGTKSVYFLGVAVDPEAELRVAPRIFDPASDQGRFLAEGDVSGVVLGRQLAENLGLELGDSASLMTITLDGAANAVDVVVRGIVDSPIPGLSKRLVYMNLSYAQRALRLPGAFTELAVALKSLRLLEPWSQGYAANLASEGFDLRTWYQLDPLIKRVEGIGRSLVLFLCALLFISAGIAIANIIYLLVAERTVEIGTLLAIGARQSDIRQLFLYEAAMIGLAGGSGGIALGALLISTFKAVGIPFQSPFHSGVLTVYPEHDLLLVLGVFSVALLVSVLAAYMPARDAASVQPVTAFRGQVL